ncbi:CHAT domain-containing protein [Streptomyces sp. NBC_00439]|uniref:CHAT domain-containing protein n=1 Tax=Streptomyces sp. NBC_00439 TaxID=2903650 RepID=UPI002259EFDE|nr:CHAT domain-containing protein [Streptomyces sp. NBC_00439]MCX5103682.1 CHAT domain-containing protein [Streptomyces sp. NBC_00439]
MTDPAVDLEASVEVAVRDMWAAMGLPASDLLCPALISYLAAFEDWERRSELLDEHPGLLSDTVDEVLDRLVNVWLTSERQSEPRPGAWSWTFACHRDVLRFLRVHGNHRERFAALEPSTEPLESDRAEEFRGSATAMVWRAGTLLRLRRHEEASILLDKASSTARREADHASEGEAELMLCQLEECSGSPADPASRQRLFSHAQRAEAAFRRAGHSEGMAHALVYAVGGAIDARDEFAVRYLLQKLRAVNEPWARWWEAYAEAMRAWMTTGDVEGLVWCRDNTGVLGLFAEGQRQNCSRKIAFSRSEIPACQELPPELRALPALSKSGGREETGAGGVAAALLEDVEFERLSTHSQVRQRELSAKHRITYYVVARHKEAQGDWEGAVDTLEKITNRGLLYQASAAWRRARAPRPLRKKAALGDASFFDALAHHFDAPGDASAKVLRYAMRNRRDRERDLEDRLVTALPHGVPTQRPVSASEVRSWLPQGHDVVLYTATGSIMLMDTEGVQRVGRFDMDAVDQAAARLGSGLADPTTRDPLRTEAALFLDQSLIQPVRAEAKGRCLSVVPTGSLWALPIGTIGARPLCDDRDLGYVPNLSVLLSVLKRDRLNRRIERFVGMADPDGTLRHARGEVIAAARHFSDETTLVGNDIVLGPALANLEDADVAHIACHGMTFPDFPEHSALRLASGPPHARFLLSQDAGGLRLNARLVVLAACHSGNSLSTGAEEYIGFPGVFLTAGAQCVIAPLWAVDDASTARVMTAFYDALASGLTPAAALRAAQRELAVRPETGHPFHWAAFQVFGVSS